MSASGKVPRDSSGSLRTWVASYERVLDGREKDKPDILERKFLEWAKRKFTEINGFSNLEFGAIQRSQRIISVDVRFDNPSEKLFPNQVPTFDNWVVIQVVSFDPTF